MAEDKIRDLIGQYIDLNKKRNQIITDMMKNPGMDQMHVRDSIFGNAKILEELKNAYLVEVDVKANPAIIYIDIQDDTISFYASAEEGLIKQHTAENGVKALKKFIKTGAQKKTKSLAKIITPSIIVVVVLAIIIVTSRTISATNMYNTLAGKYNASADDYNKAVETVDVESISGMPASYNKIKMEDASFVSALRNAFSGNGGGKISKDCATIKEITNNLESNIKIVKQIEAPQKEWVVQRLGDVDDIKDVANVSKDNDPDMMLGKDGGYLSCTYFSLNSLDDNNVPGNTLIDKGTDAGGAIEVYKNKADADAREKYLAGFDNTLLYSGSHVVVGTMVVRTSYILTDQQQVNLTDKIIKSFTKTV